MRRQEKNVFEGIPSCVFHKSPSMQILLNPLQLGFQSLRQLYARAFREAVELYVASAYLTHWENKPRVATHCNKVVFVVGTDFGLTRKAALHKVLQWLPKRAHCLFGAVRQQSRGNFHPKVLMWRALDGRHYCMIGSSNLSKAAFAFNYEANAFSQISSTEYCRIAEWVDSIAETSDPISKDWVENHYREARLESESKRNRNASTSSAVKLQLPEGPIYAAAVINRRKKQAAFSEIESRIRLVARRCANGTVSNLDFWKRFWGLWANHASRFQGSGLQISGKAANWREACSSLLLILKACKVGSRAGLDHIVSREIDALARAENPARGAWLSEMLCHYIPDSYPVMNRPVAKWIKKNRWSARRGSTEGQRYIQFAERLRIAINLRPAGARDLAELDGAIWLWVHNHHL